MMITLITGSLVLSILHALIPNHWLPVLAISRKENWSLQETTSVTFISGLSHALSTVLIGLVMGLVGFKLSETTEHFSRVIAPITLVGLGLFYIYQHHHHHHFHLQANQAKSSKRQIVISLAIAMFFSPCFEIEAYFLMAGAQGWYMIALLAIVYTVITIAGMLVWVRIVYKGLLKLNWHAWEHNAGIITGVTLILTGIISFFTH